MAVPFAFADPDLKDRQKQVEKKVDQAHEDLNESSAQLRQATIKLRSAQGSLKTAQTRLTSVRGKLSAAQLLDEQMQTKLVAAQAKLKTARKQLVLGRQKVKEQKDEVGQMVSSMYFEGDPQLLGLASVLDAKDPTEITRRLSVMDVMVDEETRAYDDLRAAEVLLVVEEKKVEDAKREVAKQRKAAAAHLKTMQSLERQAAVATSKVRTLVGDRADAQSSADWVRRKDRAALQQAEKEADRIAAMLRKRAEDARRRNSNNKGSSGAPESSGGLLSYPVKGQVTSPFGMRTHPIYGYHSLHDGTDFGAPCGAPMYATTNGRVIESYFQTAWGNRLIIDHGYRRGVGLATIYNHATRYVVGVGQYVKRGQLVGYVGTTGWSTGCHLHFTVMANGAPVNPMNWF